jgi:hypothetical protein
MKSSQREIRPRLTRWTGWKKQQQASFLLSSFLNLDNPVNPVHSLSRPKPLGLHLAGYGCRENVTPLMLRRNALSLVIVINFR